MIGLERLPEEYFERVRGLAPDVDSGLDSSYIEELLLCQNCRRKTLHFIRPRQRVGITVQIQHICPKCRREIKNTVSLRTA